VGMEQLIELVRGQIRDKSAPFVFAKATTIPVAPDELEEFVTLAIQDYSRWRPVTGKPAQLTLVVDILNYDLPSDYIDLENFPLDYRTYLKTIFLATKPTAVDVVDYYYTATHNADTIPETDVPSVVWLAASMALQAITSDQKKLNDYLSYKVPNVIEVTADKIVEISKSLLKLASDLKKDYSSRVEKTINTSKSYMTFG
jgi:hypothetical protein